MATVNVGFVPRKGKKPGKPGTPTTVDDAIVAAVRADILRLDEGDYQDMVRKQLDADNKVLNNPSITPPLVAFPKNVRSHLR